MTNGAADVILNSWHHMQQSMKMNTIIDDRTNDSGCKSIVKSLLKMIEDEQYGEVVISTQVDCDKAIARYALAVVTNDCGFVIFQGSYHWWEAGSMNLHQMSAKCFERNSIRKYFELTDQVSDLLTVIR